MRRPAPPARRPHAPPRHRAPAPKPLRLMHYDPAFVSPANRARILEWLATLRPIWEMRYSEHRPVPENKTQRRLLRPVYWLGNWQFACLGYYHPPKWIHDRAVAAEPFPPVLAALVKRIEGIAHAMYRGPDMPDGWHLNTCLVNFYGAREEAGKWIDAARVGDHKDFEPGPVASVSLGERAFFQFVTDLRGKQNIAWQQWLDDCSLQIFGGDYWKTRTFHRVQRVDRKTKEEFPPAIEGFRTRRVNFTFRYVPDRHVVPYAKLAPAARQDCRRYVRELARHAPFFADALRRAGETPE